MYINGYDFWIILFQVQVLPSKINSPAVYHMRPLDPLSSLVSPCDTSFVNFMSFDSSCGTALEQRGGGEQNKLGDRFNRIVGNRNRAGFFPKVKKPCGR
ncbi:hypothetical protein HZ326_26604 [Fusarium oxysporum f. sp. albedinis]|nr:hypothetical protein HZ326_26604 [Fusarium oxysporum f. sp. albedinis]